MRIGDDAQSLGTAHTFERRKAHVAEFRKARAGIDQPIGSIAVGVEFGEQPGASSVYSLTTG
jgi:hypothetical protein